MSRETVVDQGVPSLRDVDFDKLLRNWTLEQAVHQMNDEECRLAHEMLAAVSIFCWIRDVMQIDRRKGERRQGLLDRRRSALYADRRSVFSGYSEGAMYHD